MENRKPKLKTNVAIYLWFAETYIANIYSEVAGEGVTILSWTFKQHNYPPEQAQLLHVTAAGPELVPRETGCCCKTQLDETQGFFFFCLFAEADRISPDRWPFQVKTCLLDTLYNWTSQSKRGRRRWAVNIPPRQSTRSCKKLSRMLPVRYISCAALLRCCIPRAQWVEEDGCQSDGDVGADYKKPQRKMFLLSTNTSTCFMAVGS